MNVLRSVVRNRWVRVGTAVLVVLAVVLGGIVLVGNTYRGLREREVIIPTSSGALAGVLAMPAETSEPVGVVVFLHGDGPVEATNDGFYRPIWEALAEAGYASLSWSKRGIGGSAGNWLDQNMHDRAVEAAEAITWLRTQPGIDAARIGLWAASQGGWVFPEVANTVPDIRFAIAVGPAVNWLAQGRFNLLADLDHEHADQARRARAIDVSDRTRALLTRHATYSEYLADSGAPEPMSAERWSFVSENFTADATADLTALGHRDIPVLLLLGENDRNVDIADTEHVYRESLGRNLEVTRLAGANHSMARTRIEDNAALAVVVGVLAPRRIFAPGFLTAQRDFLRRTGE